MRLHLWKSIPQHTSPDIISWSKPQWLFQATLGKHLSPRSYLCAVKKRFAFIKVLAGKTTTLILINQIPHRIQTHISSLCQGKCKSSGWESYMSVWASPEFLIDKHMQTSVSEDSASFLAEPLTLESNLIKWLIPIRCIHVAMKSFQADSTSWVFPVFLLFGELKERFVLVIQ